MGGMKWLLVLAAGWVIAAPAQATQECGGEPGWASRSVSGAVATGDAFGQEVGSRGFQLHPTPHGWRIRMLDEKGVDLPLFSAPLRPVETNPANIAGWHFRNAANTGPNLGDVNAPQHRRRFSFGAIALDQLAAAGRATGAGQMAFGGVGELVIRTFSLTPPAPGELAAFTDMRFDLCLVWTGGGDRLDPILDADPGVAFDAVVAEMRGCGLDTQSYKLSDRMTKGGEGGQDPFLRADMDGDGVPDLITAIRRRADDAPGLAICLVGDETLVLAGYDGRIGRHLDPAYFARADWWSVHSGPIGQGVAEGAPPVPAGNAILLGKDDSSSVLVYLDAKDVVRSYWQGD